MEPPNSRPVEETLGVAFVRHSFFDCAAEELPFNEPIGMRGWLATFAFQFRGPDAEDPGLHRDIEALSRLELGTCYYGATDAPIMPFICELHAGSHELTGAEVLKALNVRDFRSDHIRSLDATSIPYPGYHPDTDNDEVHNTFRKQHIFDHEEVGEFDGAHGDLKRYVQAGQLWYILLHPTRHDGFCEFVVLFAVGRSPHGKRLVGVVTCQVCHNLCD